MSLLVLRCVQVPHLLLLHSVKAFMSHLSALSPSEHYATVSLELEDRGDETELRMECRGVPMGEEDSTREGWNRFYFQAIKQTFGY